MNLSQAHDLEKRVGMVAKTLGTDTSGTKHLGHSTSLCSNGLAGALVYFIELTICRVHPNYNEAVNDKQIDTCMLKLGELLEEQAANGNSAIFLSFQELEAFYLSKWFESLLPTLFSPTM